MDIKKILIDSGYKLTKQRLIVFDFLQKEAHLISASDLYEKIKTIDKVSVYRTLILFEELDIVQGEVVGKEKLYCVKSNHPHHHIVCRECGYVDSFECSGQEFKNLTNFTNIHHKLTLTGVCNKCIN